MYIRMGEEEKLVTRFSLGYFDIQVILLKNLFVFIQQMHFTNAFFRSLIQISISEKYEKKASSNISKVCSFKFKCPKNDSTCFI